MQRRKKDGLPRETRPVLLHGYVFCRRRDSLLCLLPEEGFSVVYLCIIRSYTVSRLSVCLPNMSVSHFKSVYLEEYASHKLCMSVSIYVYLVHQLLLSIFCMDKSFYLCG